MSTSFDQETSFDFNSLFDRDDYLYFYVVGVDLVQGFLDLGAEEARRRGLFTQFLRGDARALPWEAEFDRVICLFDVLGFFRDEDNLAVLRGVARALKPGGMFCLDVRNRDTMVRHLSPATVLEKGRDLMIDRHHFDTVTGRLVDQRIIVRDGVQKAVPFSIRLYCYTEITALLASVGLSVLGAYGDFRGAPLSLQRSRMVVISRKPG
jgi:SAM-dependent methyltransferase